MPAQLARACSTRLVAARLPGAALRPAPARGHAWGWDGRPYTGQLVVHADVAAPLATVFRKLYRLKFPIRHMRLGHMYGPRRA